MSWRPEPLDGSSNALLAALPDDEYQRILPHLERVPLRQHQVLFHAGEPLRHVYFPVRGIISLLVVTDDGTSVEAALLGREGVAGVSAFLDERVTPFEAFSQVPGEALRLPVEVFWADGRQQHALQTVVRPYLFAVMVQIARTAACNRLHPMEERLARWLLMVRDLLGSETFLFTQEVLARTLGVRRASVTEAVGALRRAGLVRHDAGVVTIVDGVGLENAACEDYRHTRAVYRALLSPPAAPRG